MKDGTAPSLAREVVKALEDLEFRDRAWVRLTTLLAALVLVPLAVIFLSTVFPSVFR